MSKTESDFMDTAFSRRRLLISSGALLGVAAASSVGLGACGSTAATKGASGTGKAGTAKTGTKAFRYAESGSLSNLNPWVQEPIEYDLANQVFSRLIYLDTRGKPVGDLAQSWKLLPDNLQLTATLRSGLTWQDGTKVTAHDFVRMYGYLSDPALKTDLGVQKMTSLFEPVASVTAPNASTVVMKFKTPLPYIMDILSFWYLVNFDNPSDTSFVKHLPIGTGPYKMVSYNQASGARLEAFSGYHGGAPAASPLQFDTYSNGTSLINDLKSGLVNGVAVGNYADLKSIANNSSYYTTRAETGCWDLMVNVGKPPFDNVKVRQALSYSLNRAEIAKAAFFGYEKPVSTPFYDQAATGYVADLVHAQSYDLAKARSLLDSAGVKGLSMSFPYPTAYPELQTLAEIWQGDLTKLGISLEIKPVASPEWESLITNPSTDVLIWSNGRCALDGAVFWSTQGNFVSGNKNSFGYTDPGQATLIAQGIAETNSAKRKAIYQKLNKGVVESAHCIAIVTFSNTWAWSSTVHGPSADLIGNLELGKVSLT